MLGRFPGRGRVVSEGKRVLERGNVDSECAWCGGGRRRIEGVEGGDEGIEAGCGGRRAWAMTNLILLALVVYTNTCPYQRPDGEVVQRTCCVATETDVGAPDGRYLFTVTATAEPCLAWTAPFDGLRVHPECIVWRKRDFRERKTPRNRLAEGEP
jgi:hypothetical protein